ncbi:hypothetical protein [Rhodococcus sp. Leaf278]|uniref:hypothetical protein n=1 Tax=Rhodococcus sp. Leaf278 TaxID=1736319 RepID=UPI001F2A6411|nr:hypothetical protein [Rhodococcus sp. Leaf278]
MKYVKRTGTHGASSQTKECAIVNLRINKTRDRRRGLVGLIAVVVSVAGCTVDDTAVPTVSGPDAAIVATVECGDDGAATVRTTFGSRDEQEVLVTKAVESESEEAVPVYSEDFDAEGVTSESELTILTSPTRGVCTTALTDRATGRVMVQVTGPAPETVEGLVRSSE